MGVCVRAVVLAIAVISSFPGMGQRLGPAFATAEETPTNGATFNLRLVPIKQGISEDREARRVKQAAELGIDLEHPEHPLLVHSYRNGRLFYVFFKTVEQAEGAQAYLLQRIRKVERFYTSARDRNPKTQVTYLVEAFKLRDVGLKKADEHYASYGLSNWYKRDVVKEYEIGFGEIENIATGDAWPFESRILYKAVQPYGPDRTLYDRVQFTQSKKWTLDVTFDRLGQYSVRSEEFRFNAPSEMPAFAEGESQTADK
jgi:hypothetical protein